MATFVLVPGAWLGAWVWEAAVAELRALGHDAVPVTLTGLDGTPGDIGLGTHVDDVLAVLKAHPGWILGPTSAGEYPKDDPVRGHPSGYLRRNFALFANVRPVKAWPQLNPLIPDLDITVIRENTEGFYPDRNLAWGYGEFMPTKDVALSLRVITKAASDRFARFSFEYARAAGEKRLSIIHKRTALPQAIDR